MSDLIVRQNLICLVLLISRLQSIATKKGDSHDGNGNAGNGNAGNAGNGNAGNGKAGKLHGHHQKNYKFQLTSAELQVYNFYRSKNRHDAEATSKERS